MGEPAQVSISHSIGKAIPNEFAKLAPWLKYIPYVGQILNIIGGIDTGTTSYADIFQKARRGGASTSSANAQALPSAIMGGIGTGFGGYSNPGAYGSPTVNKNWADYTGMVGNLFSGWQNFQGAQGLGKIMDQVSAFMPQNEQAAPTTTPPNQMAPYIQDQPLYRNVLPPQILQGPRGMSMPAYLGGR